ncbi:MAG: TIGR04282 family arsenosugar biosynthesis glycosyltransferase [Panacagrimonas sp.]
MPPQESILVFARAPVPGRCKTRLIRRLGARRAARIQAALCWKTLRTASACARAQTRLIATPLTRHPYFARCTKQFEIACQAQATGDLGRRMARAIDAALADGAQRAVLIGTDCPQLTAADLAAAFDVLQGPADVVLQPASDGGYVLIGSRVRLGNGLRHIAWSSGRECAQTQRALRGAGHRLALLRRLADVDDPVDFRRERRRGLTAF